MPPLLILLLLLMAPHATDAQELPGLLVERRLAEAAGLSVGDTVQARARAGSARLRPFVVRGVFERAADPNRISRNEYEVRFHLPDLEAMLPARDRVDRFAVSLAPGAPADSAARWIQGLAYGIQAYDSQALAEGTSTTFRVISRFHRAIGVVTVLASGIFLLCVMVIRVDERRRDVAVMRLIGISRGTVFRAVVLEALAIAALGSAAGVALGALITAAVNAHYAAVYDTALKFALLSPSILWTAGALGLGLGLAAGTLAGWRVATTPADRLGER